MAFLVPALAAGASDVLILYTSATYKGDPTLEAEEEHSEYQDDEKDVDNLHCFSTPWTLFLC